MNPWNVFSSSAAHGCIGGVLLGFSLWQQAQQKLQIFAIGMAGLAIFLIVWQSSTLSLLCAAGVAVLCLSIAFWFSRHSASLPIEIQDIAVDVRTLPVLNGSARSFDPRPYFRPEQGLFLGLHDLQPLFCPPPWPHIQLCGSTGSGKSALMGLLAAQCLNLGEAVAYFDPKEDQWAASVLQQAALCAGQPFWVLDLRPEAPPQFNLIAGLRSVQVEELLIAGLELHERGNEADFYRLTDRQMAYRLAQDLRPDDTLATLYQRHGAQIRHRAPALSGRLEELVRLQVASGASLEPLNQWVQSGGALYVLGSLRHEGVIRLQKMLLLRLLQLAENRPAARTRKMALLLDEFRHHLCKTSLEALATARDKEVHLVLAHQSLGDLQAGPEQLRPQTVTSSVIENCTLKIVYRLQDPDTAHWFAARSGDRLTYSRQWQLQGNRRRELPHQVQENRSPYCDPAVLLHLAPGEAMVFGLGLAKKISVSPFPCEQRPLAQAASATALRASTLFEHLIT